MFCTNCGSKNENDSKFCIKCGSLMASSAEETIVKQKPQDKLNDKWWHRLLKVVYIISYLPLLLIIPLVWSENLPYCYTYTYSAPSCSGSYGESFWYSLLTLLIYMAVIRLIKIAVLYIILGQKPRWGGEFKKLF